MSPATFVPNALLTYLLHSTVLTAVAWVADRLLRQDALAARQALWRTALLGAIVTAGVQVGLGVQPLGGSWGLPTTSATTAPSVVVTTASVAALPADDVVSVAPRAAVPARTIPWAWLWLGGFAVAALPFAIAYRRFRVSIASRHDVTDDVCDRLRRVQETSGARLSVRLTASDRLHVPIAFGVAAPEICVPAHGLQALSSEQQDVLLAHELAHLVRHDPAWLLVERLVSAIFFFQPLNWLVCHRLRTLAEMACDSWAVARLGDPLALAGCLTEVAGWTQPSPLLVPAIGGLRSHLGRRVERLLDGSAASADGRHGARAWLLAAVVIAAVAWLAPGVSLADKSEDKASRDKAKDKPVVVTLDDEAEAPADPPPPPAPRGRRPLPSIKAHPVVPPMQPQGPAHLVPPAPDAPDQDDPDELMTPEEQHEMERDIEEQTRELRENAGRLADDIVRHVGPRVEILKRHIERDVKRDIQRDMKPEDVRRMAEEGQRMAEEGHRMAERAMRDMRPQIDAIQHDVARTVQAALETARREIDRAARELQQGHRGLEDAHRQLDMERRRLDEDRQRLEEEKQRLQEEKERLHSEHGH